MKPFMEGLLMISPLSEPSVLHSVQVADEHSPTPAEMSEMEKAVKQDLAYSARRSQGYNAVIGMMALGIAFMVMGAVLLIGGLGSLGFVCFFVGCAMTVGTRLLWLWAGFHFAKTHRSVLAGLPI